MTFYGFDKNFELEQKSRSQAHGKLDENPDTFFHKLQSNTQLDDNDLDEDINYQDSFLLNILKSRKAKNKILQEPNEMQFRRKSETIDVNRRNKNNNLESVQTVDNYVRMNEIREIEDGWIDVEESENASYFQASQNLTIEDDLIHSGMNKLVCQNMVFNMIVILIFLEYYRTF